MEKEVRYFIFLAAFLGNLSFGTAQDFSSPPPEPMMTTEDTSGSGCGEGGNSPPPPVGLCLPINDYLLPLLTSGVVLGAFSLFRLQKKEEIKNLIP